MNMKSITKKKMGGFMCHSPAATAVCMTPDSRSAIVPGRRFVPADRCVTTTTTRDHNARLFNTARYSRLVDHDHQNQSRSKLININSSSTNTTSNLADKKSRVIFPSIKGEKALRIHGDQQRPHVPQKPSAELIESVPDNVFQVVVMRVSLHCQGCAGKVKKHLSKMEGVTSFSIELETKRVTVMGHVSPVGVLESISKVRRAEFWPS